MKGKNEKFQIQNAFYNTNDQTYQKKSMPGKTKKVEETF